MDITPTLHGLQKPTAASPGPSVPKGTPDEHFWTEVFDRATLRLQSAPLDSAAPLPSRTTPQVASRTSPLSSNVMNTGKAAAIPSGLAAALPQPLPLPTSIKGSGAHRTDAWASKAMALNASAQLTQPADHTARPLPTAPAYKPASASAPPAVAMHASHSEEEGLKIALRAQGLSATQALKQVASALHEAQCQEPVAQLTLNGQTIYRNTPQAD